MRTFLVQLFMPLVYLRHNWLATLGKTPPLTVSVYYLFRWWYTWTMKDRHNA